MRAAGLLVLSLVPLAASAQAPMAVAQKAAAAYGDAIRKKDFSAFEHFSTPDFVYVGAKGEKVTKAQALSGMKFFFGPMTIASVRTKALSAKKAEGGIVYVQEQWTKGTTKMGGPKAMKYDSYSKDEVLMVPGKKGWLTKRVKHLKSKDTLDGKPMPGM